MLSGINNLSTASPSEISKQIFSQIDANSDEAFAKTEIDLSHVGWTIDALCKAKLIG